MRASIKAIATYLPEKKCTNQDLANEFPEWTVEKIASKIGIRKRSISAEDETIADMAVSAAKKLFAKGMVHANDIDFILLCTQSPDYALPTTACIVQQQLGIPTTAGAIDFNQGCSGFIYGLSLAKGLICAGIAKNVLLITSEAYTKLLHEKDKSNRAIFGDGATATWISSGKGLDIGNFVLGSDGNGACNLIVKNGAGKNPNKTGKIHQDEFGNLISEDHIYMNGGEIFNFTLGAIPGLFSEILAKNKLKLDEVTWVVFHQANTYMLNHLRKKIGIPVEKFVIDMEDYGNTVSSTIPIVLAGMLDKNSIQENDILVLAGFGVGYSWGGVTLTMQNNN